MTDTTVASLAPTIAQIQALAEEHNQRVAREAQEHAQRELQKLIDQARFAVAKVLGLSSADTEHLLTVTFPDESETWGTWATADVRYDAPDGVLWLRFTPFRYLGVDYGYSHDEVRVLTTCGHCGGRVLNHDPNLFARDLTSLGLLLDSDYVPRGDAGHRVGCLLAATEDVTE